MRAAKVARAKVKRSGATSAPKEARRQVETGRRVSLRDPGVAEKIIAALRRGASVGVVAQEAGIAAKVLEDFLHPTIDDAVKQMQMVLWSREPWRNEIVTRLTAAVDPQIWDWISAPAPLPPQRWAAFVSAGNRFAAAADDARILAAELRSHDAQSDRALRQRLDLHQSLQEALQLANVGQRSAARRGDQDSDPHVVLVVRRMGLTLADLLPPLMEELRGSPTDAERIKSMGMAVRLRVFLPTSRWSSDAAAFERLADNLQRVALVYRSSAGAKPEAHRPAVGNRRELLRLASENGVGPYGVARMLAQIGFPASGAHRDLPPSPMDAEPSTRDARYRTEPEFVAAYECWSSVQTRKHFDLLRQVGRKKASRVGKSLAA